MTTTTDADLLDVLVIGGGVAGLSAAVALARFDQRVEVLDGGSPRNATADGVHNLLGREGIDPLELLARGRAELAGYGGTITPDRATGASAREHGGFDVTLASGGVRSARRLIVAAGVRDTLPPVDGLVDRWGRDVVHCPFCHGWEARGRRVAVLVTSPMGLHQAGMFRELTPHVTAVVDPDVPVDADQRRALEAIGVDVVDGRVAEVTVADDRLSDLRLADGTAVPCDVAVVAPHADPTTPVLTALGVPLAEGDPRVGYVHDPLGATSVPGVWVAGNTAEPFAAVPMAIASGLTAASAVVADLVAARARAAAETAAEPAVPAALTR